MSQSASLPFNPAARIFAAMFILQGSLFLWDVVIGQRLQIEARASSPVPRILGGATVFYALLGYAILSSLLGHTYPRAPTFGLPCPTVIFSLGLLMWARRPWPLYLAVIPVLWAVIGTVAAVRLGMSEDVGLLVAAIGLVAVSLSNDPPFSRQPRSRGDIKFASEHVTRGPLNSK